MSARFDIQIPRHPGEGLGGARGRDPRRAGRRAGSENNLHLTLPLVCCGSSRRAPGTAPRRALPLYAVLRALEFLLLAAFSGIMAVGVVQAETVVPPGATVALALTAPARRAFSESELVTLLTTTLQRDYVKDRGELELGLKQSWIAPVLPAEPLTVRILEMPSMGVTPSFIMRFELCAAGETLGTWQTALQAHVWREVWVAHSNLRRGQPLAGADITRERCDVLNVREALADFTLADAHLELAESVGAGNPLLARAIKARAVIHRGQVANALVQDGALSITTKVEALEDGAPGQMIHARNPISHRELNGQVLDNQTILISL